MASISKRNLLGLICTMILIGVRVALGYIENEHGLVLMNELWYTLLDYLILCSFFIFTFKARSIKIIFYGIIGLLILGNTVSLVNYKKNNERIVYNSTSKKDDVIINIENMSVGSEIYVYEREYGIFSRLKDIMYNGQGNVAFNTRMKVDWISKDLLSITYQDNNQIVEKIINFNDDEKRYSNVLQSIEGKWKSNDGRSLDITNNKIQYNVGNVSYDYSPNYGDEQNNYSTILYGNYSKPSIALVKDNKGDVFIRRVSLLNTKWREYTAA